jgi:hypothetical protein
MFRWMLGSVLAAALLAGGAAPQMENAARADNGPAQGQKAAKGKGKKKHKHKHKGKGHRKGAGQKGGNKAGGAH